MEYLEKGYYLKDKWEQIISRNTKLGKFLKDTFGDITIGSQWKNKKGNQIWTVEGCTYLHSSSDMPKGSLPDMFGIALRNTKKKLMYASIDRMRNDFTIIPPPVVIQEIPDEVMEAQKAKVKTFNDFLNEQFGEVAEHTVWQHKKSKKAWVVTERKYKYSDPITLDQFGKVMPDIFHVVIKNQDSGYTQEISLDELIKFYNIEPNCYCYFDVKQYQRVIKTYADMHPHKSQMTYTNHINFTVGVIFAYESEDQTEDGHKFKTVHDVVRCYCKYKNGHCSSMTVPNYVMWKKYLKRCIEKHPKQALVKQDDKKNKCFGYVSVNEAIWYKIPWEHYMRNAKELPEYCDTSNMSKL